MAGEDVGSIVYQVDMDTSEAISGAQKVSASFDMVQKSADQTSKTLSNLDSASASAGAAIGAMSKDSKDINSSFRALSGTAAAVAKSLNDNRSAVSSSSREMQLADKIVEGLGNQLAILEEAQQGSARSAAILAAQLRAGDGATDAQKKNIADLTGRLYDMRNSTESVQKSGKSLGYAFGQLGYQVQDIAVSLQGGQNALLVFGQQGSQIAGIFGPGGAVVGAVLAVGAALASALIPSLMQGGNEMDKLRKAAEDLDKVVKVSSNGVAALSNDYALLAKTNAVVAAQLRDNAIAEYQKKVEDAGKAVRDVVVDQSSFFRSLTGGTASVAALGNLLDGLSVSSANVGEAFSQISKNSGNSQAAMQTFSATVGMMSSNLGISEQQAFALIRQLNELAKNPSEANINGIITALNGMKSSSKDGQQAIQDLLKSVSEAGAEVLTAAAKVDQLKKSLNDLQTAAQAQNFESLSRSLKQQTIQLTMGAQAAKEFAISQEDLTDEQKASLIQQSRQVAALEAQKKSQDEATRAASSSAKSQATAADSVAQKLENLKEKADVSANSTKELSREQAILTAQQSLGKSATQEQIALAGQYAATAYDNAAALKAQADAEKKKQEIQKNYQSVRDQASPVTATDNQFSKDMAALNAYAQQYPAKIEEVEATRSAIEKKYRDTRMAAMWTEWQQQSVGAQVFGEALDTSLNTVSSSLTGILTGTQTVNEALANIANTVLSSVVQSFVQMGAQWLKSYIMGQVGMSAAVASGAAGAATLATAWAPAAALSSLATAGANAVPAQAGIAATAGLAQGLAVAGMRKNGGPVSSGSMYQVGEGGMPEIFKASSGKQYMIPGDDGSVISNKDINSGSGSGIVIYNNITNNSSATVSTTATDNGDGSVTISTIVADINEGGPIGQAISTNYTTNRRATE